MAEGAAGAGTKLSAPAGTQPGKGPVTPVSWLEKLFGAAKKKTGFDFKLLNIVLILAIVLLAGYFVRSVFASIQRIENLNFTAGAPGRSKLTKESLLLKEPAVYMDVVQKRDIFKMGPKKPAEKTDDVVSSAAVEATKSLKLVGIAWSDNPDAIIEDERTKQTFFIKKGGMVGDIVVESISREKVILRVGQEAIELR